MKHFFTLLILLIGFTLKSQVIFQSIATGNWNAPSTWTITSGADADGIPDNTDSVIIHSGHIVKLTVAQQCKGICILAGGQLFPNTKALQIQGGLYNAGTITGGNLALTCNKAGLKIESVNPITIGGSIWVNKSITIVAGTVINLGGFFKLQNAGTVVTNNGSISVQGGINGIANNAKWINGAGSSLYSGNNIVKPALAKVDFSTFTNTVTYGGSATIDMDSTTYTNLVVTGGGVKRLMGKTIVKGDMTIAPTGSLSLQYRSNGKKLILYGNITNSTQFFQSSAGDTLMFMGSATTQTVGGTFPINCYDVIINKAAKTNVVLFNTNLNVSHELNVRMGTCNSGNNRVILQSNTSTTARLATITTTANVDFTGSMVIQRFFPTYTHPVVVATPSLTYNYFYHDLSSPVKSTTVMDWDNEIYISGIGPYDGVWGPAGVDGQVSGTNPYTMNTYNEPTDTWTGVTGSTTTLTPGKGYNLLLLDDNDNQGANDFIWNGKIIDTRGIPNFGDVVVPNNTFTTGKGIGYNLVGNPYASPITLAGARGTNWDLSGTAATRTINASVYFADLNTGAFSASSRETTTISPHQGFMIVRTNAANNPNVNVPLNFTFKEVSKVPSYGTTANFKREAQFYDIKLSVSSAQLAVSHECEVNFDSDANIGYDDVDAIYKQFRPIAPNIYFTDASYQFDGLINNYISSKEDEVVLPMRVFTPQAGMYTINASVLNTDAYNYVWIESIKTGEKYDINKSMAIEGKEQNINTDYVLRLTKKKQNNSISKTILSTDLLVFNTENTLNLKSTYADHQLSEVTLYDISGKLVLQENNITVLSNNVYKIDLTHLALGVYIVKAIDNSGQVISKKIIK